MIKLKHLLESFKSGDGWFIHEGTNSVSVVFEDGKKLSFDVNFGGKTMNDRDKLRSKAASTWSSLARESYNNPELNEIGNPIQKSWLECFQEALSHEKMKPFHVKETNLFEGIDVPAQIQQVSHQNFAPDFIKFIKSIENGNKIGFKNGKWYPHNSPEGGLPTIGYGHKLTKDETVKYTHGLSDQDVEKLLVSDLNKAKSIVHDYIKKKYKVNLTLTSKQEEMLTEFAFNLGGLDKFPKFVDAVLRQQWGVVKKEYKRKFNSNGSMHDLSNRNHAFFNRFLV